MSSIFNSRRRSGFTLIELLVVIAIIAILAAILFPVFAKARAKARQASGASNQKQIALAFLQYIQDYDEKFPPLYGFNGTQYQSWGVDYNVTTPTNTTVQGLLSSYTKANALFVDPSGPRPGTNSNIIDYTFNDLLAGKSQAAIAAVSSTVLTCDGNGAPFGQAGGFFSSTGTAWANTSTAAGSVPGASSAGLAAGHAVGTALATTDFSTPGNRDVISFDQVTRHSDGANFSYSDGHVKWAKITLDTTNAPCTVSLPCSKTVYFPAQTETSTSANTTAGSPLTIEPVPGGDMRGYAATFHLN